MLEAATGGWTGQAGEPEVGGGAVSAAMEAVAALLSLHPATNQWRILTVSLILHQVILTLTYGSVGTIGYWKLFMKIFYPEKYFCDTFG